MFSVFTIQYNFKFIKVNFTNSDLEIIVFNKINISILNIASLLVEFYNY